MFRPNTNTLAKDADIGPSEYNWLEIYFIWRSLNITLWLYGFQSFHTVEGYWPQVDDIDMICDFKIVISGQFRNVWYTYPNIRQYAMLFHIVKFSQLHVSNCRPLTMFERASDRELAGLYHNYIWRSPECIIPFLSQYLSSVQLFTQYRYWAVWVQFGQKGFVTVHTSAKKTGVQH